ncbi:Sodium/alanine symporter AgcS [Hyella patelloides LEGE 07179]|uniref:Sodium/alanine symporter AgcS n=1 Tax=Hyella patelloides LEGE 07179 TaxID=945734 RepID=A0A563VQ35_9CYAN|nr:alanine/glycine:cation symporter family protein [Hyella patelloides]VEP13499.1 Sodium/alanine symporter AgcS [Hyella patelloides LEGE 07179]
MEQVLFVSIAGIPLIILWLVLGSIFFTIRFGFIGIRGFKHALDIARGKYDTEEGTGEVSAFEALATALSSTVGLGNIAGVAIAIQMGGTGAVFWMSMAAFFGMASKFIECTLGQQYRQINPDGTVSGGPMYYLSEGLQELGFAKLGKIMGLVFAIFCTGASFGGGNMFQVNQSFAAITALFPSWESYNWLFGILAAIFVGLVILGGINRIGIVTSKLVPLMIGIYLAACLWVIAVNITEVPQAINTIWQQAFSANAIEGGFVGMLVLGIRRSAFSNGAGMGTAAIAHSAAKTDEPIKEGIVAILEPFIDTIIICNLTALVIILTGTYGNNVAADISGSELTALAFSQIIDWFPYVLAVVILLFGFSTTVAWSYYGEKSWAYLFGKDYIFIYKGLFLICIFLGAIIDLGVVVDFSDMMLIAMAVPNILGCLLLSNKVAKSLSNYWFKLNLKSIISNQ